MDYAELIDKAIKGRSVNGLAKTWGLPQKTLESYVKGKTLPNYSTAEIFAHEAGISLAETMRILINEEQRRKPLKEIITAGFLQLTNALNRLFSRMYAS